MKRLFAITMVALMLTTAMSGCKKDVNNEVDEGSSNPVAADVKYADLGENILALAGEHEITMNDINICIDLIVNYVQQSTGSAPGWEDIVLDSGLTARDELINAAIEEARYQHAFIEYAKSEGLYSDADADAEFQEYVSNIGGEEVLNELLTEYGFSEEALKKYIVYMGAYSAFVDSSCTDEEADRIFNEEYITAKHILIMFEGRDSEDAAFEEAKAIYDRAVAGENFEDLINEFNEDPGQDVSTGYTFTVGTMVDEFYEGALALEVGSISEPIKTDFGYHIIKRYSNPDKEADAYGTYIANVKSAKANELMTEEKYNNIIANYPLTIDDDSLGEINLSKYTVEPLLDENVNYADGSVFNE